MTTSGTTAFNPDVATLIEEAYERAGVEGRSGYELRSAVRSLNIMAAEWANMGLNLWTVETGTIALSAGDSQYDLPTDTVDILEHGIELSDGSEYRIKRYAFTDWAGIVHKTQTGRPTVVYVERLIAPRINLWPVPDQAYTFVYWRMRRIQDAGTPEKTMDIPHRAIPAMVSGLALHLALKRSVPDPNRIQMLKDKYAEDMANFTYEDRERASVFIRPRIRK